MTFQLPQKSTKWWAKGNAALTIVVHNLGHKMNRAHHGDVCGPVDHFLLWSLLPYPQMVRAYSVSCTMFAAHRHERAVCGLSWRGTNFKSRKACSLCTHHSSLFEEGASSDRFRTRAFLETISPKTRCKRRVGSRPILTPLGCGELQLTKKLPHHVRGDKFPPSE